VETVGLFIMNNTFTAFLSICTVPELATTVKNFYISVNWLHKDTLKIRAWFGNIK